MPIDTNNLPDDVRETVVPGIHGRDAGKTFYVVEIDPITFSGVVLQLISALRVDSYEALLEDIMPAEGKDVPLDAIMNLLKGCDPKAVHQLIHDVLEYVLVSPDPRHPGVKRPLLTNEIRELRTLGDILKATVSLNFGG